MSNKSIRIPTKANEFVSKNVKVNLEQDFDILEILSLSISQEDVYRRFCSDYGVVVGRVIMNNGVGVPNAKVSIFVPIDGDVDEETSEKYPYSSIKDKDSDGKRYNLLPDNRQIGCHTPVGTLVSKSEILDNDDKLDIHCKYYKYSAITNHAGDYMIFGVPTGTHFVNIDVDLSDIGIYSQKPYDFIREGQPKESFDGTTKFKESDDLDKLIQVKNTQTSVNVSPFWGDDDNCEVGITRLDFDTKHNIKPCAIFMGSIFSDNEKNSLNKQCRPRRKFGSLCETITTSGSMQMIRKTLDDSVESFDVDGGRVINDDGAWAYQIPMNLDYMVTDEYGDLVPTDDPSRGIPTRTRVRFKAGMDPTGDEGRLRHRAKYLIPHNPDNSSESDYSFDETTKDIHFRDMMWNQIYSVKNFIPRTQKNRFIDIRSFTGIKNVDDCTGTHNPFPYNRLDSDINPLFSVLCIIITIIATLVILINSIVLNIINGVLLIINTVLNVINDVIWWVGKLVCGVKHALNKSKRVGCREDLCDRLKGDCGGGSCSDCNKDDPLNYIPCITLSCNGEEYGPGCISGSGKSLPFNSTDVIDNYPDDGDPDHEFDKTRPPGDGGWTACVTIEIADALNVWELDFYNDWVNGSLYSFLLKYKKKKRGKEKFCEYDCRDFGGGVDGNEDGKGDNRCKRSVIVDSCTSGSNRDGDTQVIKDGMIKNYKGELYYAAYTHETDYKLYATDIINLGAVFDCDWLGNPKIQKSLIPTTYNLSPLLNESDDDENKIILSGLNSPRADIKQSLFFNLNCLGLFTSHRTCRNIKRQCEIGVGLNEDRVDEIKNLGCTPTGGGGGNIYSPNSGELPVIDNCDIEGLFVRDVLTMLNEPNSGIDLTTNYEYDHALFGGPIYNNYRNYSNNDVKQPRGNSYYFYFGLNPGKTALDLMNKKYFSECNIPEKNDFIILGDVTDVTNYGGSDGSIDVTVVGGVGPYTYNWSDNQNSTTEDISGLKVGTYTVTVTDLEGKKATRTFTVNQPLPVTCFSAPQPVSQNGLSDGTIEVIGVGGGTAPYTVTLTGPGSTGNVQTKTINSPSSSTSFNNLPEGVYSTIVEDSSSTTITCEQTNIEITTPPPISINVEKEDIECYGYNNGEINISYITGVPPMTYQTTGPNNYNSSQLNQNGLKPGQYTVTGTDNINQTTTETVNITEANQINITATVTDSCGSGSGKITLQTTGGSGPYTYKWTDDQSNVLPETGPTISNLSVGYYDCEITSSNGCSEIRTYEIKESDPIEVIATGLFNGVNIGISGGAPSQTPPYGDYICKLKGPKPSQSITTALVSGQSHTFNYLPTGEYDLEVTDYNGCSTEVKGIETMVV